ncbi:dihydrodipicolinate synthase family protein [Microbacterium sp. A93]|uniref:dihydrodipicolinate synthase family protein n=1 Tax=Microbacterium sp. A93 TaxID=3450716 RepID=UPI003F6E3F61
MTAPFGPPSAIRDGTWPVMLTPFHADRSIDWKTLDRYTEWLISHGASGLFAVALSSEMYQLSPTERHAIARRVASAAEGRVPVVASAIASSSVDEQVAAIQSMAKTGVDAVVLISSLIATELDTDATLSRRLDEILNRCPDQPLGVYECPIPYKRPVTDEMLTRLAHSGQVVFFKDTSHSIETMHRRIAITRGTPLRMFNAEITSLTATRRAGGAGFSGYAANVFPELVQRLCADPEASGAVDIQRLLSIAEGLIGAGYPASAKLLVDFRSAIGMSQVCRSTASALNAHDAGPIQDLADYIASTGLLSFR